MTSTIKINSFGDFELNEATGRFVEIIEGNKLRQDVRQNQNIDVQTNGTGAGLSALVGKVSDPFTLRAEIASRLTDSLETLQKLQNSIQKAQRSKKEKIGVVTSVQVYQIIGTDGKPSKTEYGFSSDVKSEDFLETATNSGTLPVF